MIKESVWYHEPSDQLMVVRVNPELKMVWISYDDTVALKEIPGFNFWFFCQMLGMCPDIESTSDGAYLIGDF